MNHKGLPETPPTLDAKKEKIVSASPNVKVILSDAPSNLNKQEAAVVYHYGLLMYNFCS